MFLKLLINANELKLGKYNGFFCEEIGHFTSLKEPIIFVPIVRNSRHRMKEKCPNSFELKWHRVHQDDNNDNDNDYDDDNDNDDDNDDDSDDDNINKKKERKKERKRRRGFVAKVSILVSNVIWFLQTSWELKWLGICYVVKTWFSFEFCSRKLTWFDFFENNSFFKWTHSLISSCNPYNRMQSRNSTEVVFALPNQPSVVWKW